MTDERLRCRARVIPPRGSWLGYQCSRPAKDERPFRASMGEEPGTLPVCGVHRRLRYPPDAWAPHWSHEGPAEEYMR